MDGASGDDVPERRQHHPWPPAHGHLIALGIPHAVASRRPPQQVANAQACRAEIASTAGP
jgi:hypothetical protein